jgi:uncharacterized repeat protein (TIGR03803 family)
LLAGGDFPPEDRYQLNQILGGNMKSRILTCVTTMTLLSALAIPTRLVAQNALGLKYTVLYTFTGGADGAVPYAGVIRDEAGNLYGATNAGGDLSGRCGGGGCGVVFRLDQAGHEVPLYTFTGATDGGAPYGTPVRDEDGNLYGTAPSGGDPNCPFSGGGGCGVAFKIDAQGNYTVIHTFEVGTGINPPGGLTRDSAGNLYGTAVSGGGNGSGCSEFGCGVVFKLTTGNGGQWTESVLYSFTGGMDGIEPSYYEAPALDNDGNLYGTTINGGPSNQGVVFKVDPQGHETILYAFTGGADGGVPTGSVILDDARNLYGTASVGGTSNAGVVFKLDSAGNYTVLYTFTGGTDGNTPYGGLVRDQQGNLYGTTNFGGNQGSYCGGFCGVVFKVDTNLRETVLYAFTGQADGLGPYAGLFRDNNGNLYGTTGNGGDLNCPIGGGCGVVFKLSACRTALCHGEDDADTAPSTTDPATVSGNLSTVAPANPAISDRPNLDRLSAQRFPRNRSLGATTAPTN